MKARAAVLLLILALAGCPSGQPFHGVSFVVAADVRNFSFGTQYFEGACQAIAQAGGGDFMISPGDMEPPDDNLSVISARLGPSYPWVPVVGNHEIDTLFGAPHAFSRGIDWIKSQPLPDGSSAGPPGSEKTTFSFDRENVHFVVLNEYYDGSSDDVLVGHGILSNALLAWLDADLAARAPRVAFVMGHEPAFPQADGESGRLRHRGESLDADPAQRDLFWSILRGRGVRAYICGHTHNFSVVRINGVWQVDVGHARGFGDTGARSTFIRIFVTPSGDVSYEAWRMTAAGTYEVTAQGGL